MQVYLYRNDEQFGPYSVDQIQAFVDTRSFSPADSAWFEGCDEWTTISHVPGIVISEEKLRHHLVPPFESYAGDKPYVFVSYAHTDGELVFREINILHEAGYRIWYDEGIEPGNDWPEHIANAVIDCSLFLMFTSPRSAASENCRNEVNLALNRKKKFLAVYLEETELPPGLELRMGDLQAILKFKMPEATYRKKVYQGMENLLGPNGRDQLEGEDLVAEVMAVEDELDFLQAPVDEKGATINVTSRKSGKIVTKLPRRAFTPRQTVSQSPQIASKWKLALAKDFRIWGAGGLIAILCLGWLISIFFSEEPLPHIETNDTITSNSFTPSKPWTVPSISMHMIWCEPGTFRMGSPKTQVGRELNINGKKIYNETSHLVNLTQGFYLGQYEVTQAQWEKIMGTSPSQFVSENRPVEMVSWNDALRFCKELSLVERKAGSLPDGWEYGLPTEAQWEYACRAGTTTVFSFGNSLSSKQANFDGSKPYGDAVAGVFLNETTEVGSYAANPWGFHDMHGNVWEWVNDFYEDYSASSATDPQGAISGDHVLRGGGWGSTGNHLRSARRSNWTSKPMVNHVGFRVCLRPVMKPRQPAPGHSWTVPSTSIEMLWCKPGTFMMGSPENEVNRGMNHRGVYGINETRHKVTLTQGFHLGKYEVTQSQWRKIMASSPSAFPDDDKPVDNVSWDMVMQFCHKLTLLERKAGRLPDDWEYRLPTEAQWEYACRAGTTTAFAFGNTLTSKQANVSGPYGTKAKGPSIKSTSPVGAYPPNPWGFHDMHGNLWEWCHDAGHLYTPGSMTDPVGTYNKRGARLRGGGWNFPGKDARSAMRNGHPLKDRRKWFGFRLSLQPKVPSQQSLPPKPNRPWIVPGLSLDMIWCEPGTFSMGSPKDEPYREIRWNQKGKHNSDETQHKVTLTKGFFLGKYELTQAQWQAVMNTSPSHFKEFGLPVENVSWEDAMAFCKKLNEREHMASRLPEGWSYGLPTEAQWEYACRAGTTTATAFGDSISSSQANFNGAGKLLGNKAKGPFLNRTAQVGSYKPNAWGFHDMHGNVKEWVSDWYGKYPHGPFTNPSGPKNGSGRVRRDISWNEERTVRSASRWHSPPDYHHKDLGFRVCLRQDGN